MWGRRFRLPTSPGTSMLIWFAGSILSRFDTRAFLVLLFQAPPRSVGGLVPVGPFPQNFHERLRRPKNDEGKKKKEKRKKNKGKLIPRTPDAEVEATVRRYAPDPVRRARAPDTVEPGTAPQRPGRPTRGALWIFRIARRVVCIPIRHPLPHVPQHVVQSPCVGLLSTHVMRLAFAVSAEPGDSIEIAVTAPGAARPRRILPLGLAHDRASTSARRSPTESDPSQPLIASSV
jgi:hypothetical protein